VRFRPCERRAELLDVALPHAVEEVEPLDAVVTDDESEATSTIRSGNSAAHASTRGRRAVVVEHDGAVPDAGLVDAQRATVRRAKVGQTIHVPFSCTSSPSSKI
jgi:hypothetical protein